MFSLLDTVDVNCWQWFAVNQAADETFSQCLQLHSRRKSDLFLFVSFFSLKRVVLFASQVFPNLEHQESLTVPPPPFPNHHPISSRLPGRHGDHLLPPPPSSLWKACRLGWATRLWGAARTTPPAAKVRGGGASTHTSCLPLDFLRLWRHLIRTDVKQSGCWSEIKLSSAPTLQRLGMWASWGQRSHVVDIQSSAGVWALLHSKNYFLFLFSSAKLQRKYNFGSRKEDTFSFHICEKCRCRGGFSSSGAIPKDYLKTQVSIRRSGEGWRFAHSDSNLRTE